jgi:hypothetical protein
MHGRLPSPFTARDVYRNEWTGLTEPRVVQGALACLEDLGRFCETKPPRRWRGLTIRPPASTAARRPPAIMAMKVRRSSGYEVHGMAGPLLPAVGQFEKLFGINGGPQLLKAGRGREG